MVIKEVYLKTGDGGNKKREKQRKRVRHFFAFPGEALKREAAPRQGSLWTIEGQSVLEAG